jgi:Uroporphyrinogen decarboxylase (URO-D).
MTKYPYNKKEVSDMGMYSAVPGMYGLPSGPVRKFDTPITPKENFLRIYRGERIAWLPNMATDCNMLQPEVMPDAYARNHGGSDWFGIEWEYEALTNAAMVKPATRRLSDITKWREELLWPDLNAIDWEKDYKENYEPVIDSNRVTMFAIVNGLFERTADLTNFADTFCYLLEEPEELTAFFEKLVDFHIDLIKIAKKYYHADIITFHDDMGSQKDSFMSPNTFKEIMMPHYQKITSAVHELGMFINYHSCGSVGNLLPYFIESGFDSWEGQDSANNKVELMNEYGDQLIQAGMIFFPEDATDEQVDEMIDEALETLGKKERFFLAYSADMKIERNYQSMGRIYEKSRKFYNQ